MKNEIYDYIVGWLRPLLADRQSVKAGMDFSVLLPQTLGANGLGLSTGKVIALALDIEERFGIRLGEQQTEQLTAMSLAELVDCVLALVEARSMRACTTRELPTRTDILHAIADLTGQGVEAVPESLDSMEVLWLLAEMERRYGRAIDLPPDAYQQIQTVDCAVSIFREVIAIALSSDAHEQERLKQHQRAEST